MTTRRKAIRPRRKSARRETLSICPVLNLLEANRLRVRRVRVLLIRIDPVEIVLAVVAVIVPRDPTVVVETNPATVHAMVAINRDTAEGIDLLMGVAEETVPVAEEVIAHDLVEVINPAMVHVMVAAINRPMVVEIVQRDPTAVVEVIVRDLVEVISLPMVVDQEKVVVLLTSLPVTDPLTVAVEIDLVLVVEIARDLVEATSLPMVVVHAMVEEKVVVLLIVLPVTDLLMAEVEIAPPVLLEMIARRGLTVVVAEVIVPVLEVEIALHDLTAAAIGISKLRPAVLNRPFRPRSASFCRSNMRRAAIANPVF